MRRSLALLKDAHPVQRVMRNTQASAKTIEKAIGKRHTIMHEPYFKVAKRLKELEITSAFEDIQRASYFLPRVEKEVEKVFVEDIKEKLDDVEKDALDATYKFRRRRVDRRCYLSFLKPLKQEVIDEPLPRIRPDFEILNESHPKEEEIGQYFKLSEEEAKKLFRNGYFGNFWQSHVTYCRTYDIMMREETWRIVNNARNSQKVSPQPQEEEVDPACIEGKEPLQRLGWFIFNHKPTYLQLHKSLSSLLLDHLYATDDLALFNIMRNSAELFNSTVAVLIHELSKSQFFQYFSQQFTFKSVDSFLLQVLGSDSMKEIVKGIMQNYSSAVTDPKDINSVIHFEPFVKFLAKEFRFSVEGQEFVIPLQQYSDRKTRFRVPASLEKEVDQTGSLGVGSVVAGHRGTGKSQVLAGAAAWAFKEGNWILIKVARGSDFTKGASPFFWEPEGMYFHPEVGWDLLKEILELNAEKLEQVPVDMKIYGKFTLSGMHPEYDKGNEPLINRHVFMREEQFWTDDWKKFYDEETLEDMFKGPRYYPFQPRMSRFEYEMNLLSKERIPKKFIEMMEDGPMIFDDIPLDDLFDINCPKRKPKKHMDPKSSPEDLNARIKEKVIHPQDLVIEKTDDLDLEKLVPPLIQVLPSPKNLKELVEFGLSSHLHSVNVLYELMEQLYRTDKFNVMVLVDEFDAFFKNSDYPSLKYMNFRHCREAIAPTDISLSRLFMRFDGHMIRNGLKVVAVSEKEMNYHVRRWKGDPVNAGPDFCMEVGKLALDDLRKLSKYLYFFEWAMFELSESDIAAIHMMSQGNFSLALQNIEYSTVPTY